MGSVIHLHTSLPLTYRSQASGGIGKSLPRSGPSGWAWLGREEDCRALSYMNFEFGTLVECFVNYYN